jgi:hypothetical protein
MDIGGVVAENLVKTKRLVSLGKGGKRKKRSKRKWMVGGRLSFVWYVPTTMERRSEMIQTGTIHNR